VEFALVLPVALVLALAITQTALLMGALPHVQRAAFAAARAAIVQIPGDPGAPDRNRYQANGPKHERIRRAAAAALVPVAGRATPGDESYGEAIADHFRAFDQTPPQWAGALLSERFRYARRHTSLDVMRRGEGAPRLVRNTHRFGARDDVAARVRHRLHLSVPLARWIFADGENADGPYANVSARAALPNAGMDPSLPPEPDPPRVEPNED
jgi:hypothetical protein